MSDETITPALTPEEWSYWLTTPGPWLGASGNHPLIYARGSVDNEITVDGQVSNDGRHELAALCLYRQPFGFAREDVHTLRAIMGIESIAVGRIADKIAALLPPEKQ